MISKGLQSRLELLDPNLVDYSDKELYLIETKKDGYAELKLCLNKTCILFKGMEDKKLEYFTIKKCADFVLFELGEDSMQLHIFEMKKSIGTERWETIKKQFRGAMLNAMAIRGYLDIACDFNKTIVYSVYRNDKINDVSNPVKMHSSLHRNHDGVGALKSCKDWNDAELDLNILGLSKLKHRKIQLDLVTGKAEIVFGK